MKVLLAARLPAPGLSKTDRRELRGVSLDRLTKESAKLLSGIDLSKVTLRARVVEAEAIPARLARLVVDGSIVGAENLSSGLELRHLSLGTFGTVHANRLAALTLLEFLLPSERTVRIGLLHPRDRTALRWKAGFMDQRLTAESAEAVRVWLGEAGAPVKQD